MISAKNSLLIPILALALNAAGNLAQEQPEEAAFGTILNLDDNSEDANANMTCDVIFNLANMTINAHPKWHEWLDEIRQNQSNLIDKCESELGKDENELKSFLDYQKDLLACTGSHSHMTIVAVVFIIGFVLAVIGLIALSILYYRK